ncbi:MAG: iron ABC transporter permease [Synechococcales bacterium]|nr:iron ABC transporter permease [Synechococcales bacterium]
MAPNWLVMRSNQIPVSFRLHQRVPKMLLLLGSLILVVLVLSVSYGEYPVPPLDVVWTVLGLETGNPDYAFIVNTLRLPRVLVALLVGMALAIAGTITQGILRNPLAAPDIIGINAGAALAAVTLIIALPGVSVSILPIAAFVGGFTVFTLIYLLAWNRGSSPLRLVLVGIGFSLMTGAITNILVTFGDIYDVSQALVWLAGSVYGRSWDEVGALLPWLGAGIPAAMLMARDLNALSLGDDLARGIGSPVEWRRGLLLVISVALAGAAVATAGTVGFVGFIAPHIARRLVGPTHEGLLPTAALTGGLLVVLADLVGRTLFAPIELPCGLVTSALGAPYFLYLLIQRRQ